MVNRDRELERMQSVKLTKQFAEQEGRRPRILIAEMEEDGSKKERKLAAAAFADAGWDVDVGSLETPEDTARNAVDNDVHFISFIMHRTVRGEPSSWCPSKEPSHFLARTTSSSPSSREKKAKKKPSSAMA